MEIALGTLMPKMSILISRCRRFWKRITYMQNGNAEDNTTIPASNADHAKSDAWNPAIIIIIGICILLIVSSAVIFVRKKNGSEEE